MPHFVWTVRPCKSLGEQKSPLTAIPTSENLLRYVEGLNDARTPLGERCVLADQGWAGENRDFFSILVRGGG